MILTTTSASPSTSTAAPTFANLKTLSIAHCDHVQMWPGEWFHNFSSITDMKIWSWPSLTSPLSLALENLVIGDCEEFSFSNDIEDEKQPIWGDLKNLHSIDLRYVSNSVSLPQGLKSVPALDAVWIWNCLVRLFPHKKCNYNP